MQSDSLTSRTVRPRNRAVALSIALAAAALMLGAIVPQASGARSKRKAPHARPADGLCLNAAVSRAIPGFPDSDAWRSSAAYKFPFNGYTPRGNGTVLWNKFPGSRRKTHYPAPNLPSCRVGARGTDDRKTRKVGQYLEMLQPIDGMRSYTIVDSFERPVTTLRWEETSPIARRPSRWGWYVGDKWAGHDAERAFEVQGNACKLRVQADTVMAGEPPVPVTSYRWVPDANFAMIAFNPALGSPGRGYRPSRTAALRVRGFIDRRALPGWAGFLVNAFDFGCGATALEPLIPAQTLGVHQFKSGYGPDRQYLIGQYFGESAVQLELLPGETRVHNNIPYSSYSPKPQFGNAVYAMINSTAVAGGGMVRGIARAGVDEFILHDEMTYCDPNYTLRNMLLKRNGRRVSKWTYFEIADFARQNAPMVRWVFGQIKPGAATVSPEAAQASANPASQRLLAWMPIHCDR